jgi:hypothetical protein
LCVVQGGIVHTSQVLALFVAVSGFVYQGVKLNAMHPFAPTLKLAMHAMHVAGHVIIVAM